MTDHPLTLSFTTEQELAMARSACKRLLASPTAHLSDELRCAVSGALTDLMLLGRHTGCWSVAMTGPRQHALYLAVARQRQLRTASPDARIPENRQALNVIDRLLAMLPGDGTFAVADPDVVRFVRLGFTLACGPVRFEVPMPDRSTFLACLADGIGQRHHFDGNSAAAALGPLWDDVSTITIGRDGEADPMVRIRLPQHQQQRNGNNGAHTGDAPLSELDTLTLTNTVMAAAKSCRAATLIRHDGLLKPMPVNPSYRPTRGRPDVARLIWPNTFSVSM